MIPFWKKTPFFRLLLPLIAGIISEHYCQLPVYAVYYFVSVGITFWYIVQKFSSFNRFSYAYFSGIFIYTWLFALGIAITMCHELRFNAEHFSSYFHKATIYSMRIEEPLIEKSKTYRAIASVRQVLYDGNKISVNGRCYIYFRKGALAKKLQYGSLIYTDKIPQSITKASDTASFDFKKYAALQGIYHQVYLKDDDYIISGIDTSFSIYKYLFQLRSHLITIIHQYIPDPRHAAVAIALLTGYRMELNQNLTQVYQSTGTIHIIAISGMHLALIYFLLQFVFNFLVKSQKLNVFKEVAILVLLWLFSLLTGGGASVIRAVIMFSFISFGKIIHKKGSIENALAVSAFFMLCYNPYLLWDIGFQLSYAAVLSLVIFMKPLYEMITIQNPMLDGLWKMNAVTLSAQILTLPLCIYHFHQMPVLFLPANLIAVPLSTLALYGLLLLAGISSFPLLGNFAGKMIAWLIQWMNDAMTYLSYYRFAVMDELTPGLIDIIFLYGIISFSYIVYLTANKKYFFGGLVCVLLIAIKRVIYLLLGFNF
jgi:competence protein ComEC